MPPRARVALALALGLAASLAAPGARAQEPAPPAPWVYEPEGDVAASPHPYAPPGATPSQPTQRTQPYAPPGVTPPATVFALGYDPNLPPPRAHYVSSPVRQNLIVGGGVIFGLSYLITAALGASMNAEKSGEGNNLFVPVAGPFLEAMKTDDPDARYALSFTCGMQLIGAASMLTGLAMPPKVLVSGNLARARLAPVPLGRGGGGLALVGTF